MEHRDSTASVEQILRQDAERVDERLRRCFHDADMMPGVLADAVSYSLMAPGKRLRPTLVIESARLIGGDRAAESATTIAAAAAIELIHTFSLVHDDLPAMDDDDLRRGKPTSHKVFGEAMAILAGDAMMTLAFEVLSRDAEAQLLPQLVLELSCAAGPVGMIGGQVLDMEGEKRDLALEELRRVHRMKTGAMLTAACRLGALSAAGSEADLVAVTKYGNHLGLAFQIIDDILDETSTPEQLGKATNKDARRGKNTYPSLLGLEQSRAEAAQQLEQATLALAPFGAAAETLLELARFIVQRQR